MIMANRDLGKVTAPVVDTIKAATSSGKNLIILAAIGVVAFLFISKK